VRKFLSVAAFLALVAVAAIWFGWNRYQVFLEHPLDLGPESMVLNVEPGMSGRAVIGRIIGLGLSDTEWPWRLLMRPGPPLSRPAVSPEPGHAAWLLRN
jgi:hypothetical protein